MSNIGLQGRMSLADLAERAWLTRIVRGCAEELPSECAGRDQVEFEHKGSR